MLKTMGFLAETDYALFIETKNNKRIIHFRSTKFPARTLATDDPDSSSIEDFNLQSYVDKLSSTQNEVDDFIL